MLQRMLREPLLYFLLVGAGLFMMADRLGGEDGRRIVVTDAERARLSEQWQAQMGRPATDAELAALVEQWIREEIYYREAIAMGLDDDDVIIRRRLAQKLTFLTEDLATAETPGEKALRAYHRAHAERYAEPARFSFEHRYFSAERRQDPEADARAALAAMIGGEAVDFTGGAPDASGGAPDGAAPAGDPFMLQRSYLERSQREIGELFGREFAAGVAELPPGSWQGPLASAYGWHLVRVEQQRPARPLEFGEVAERVAADYRQDQRRQASEAYYRSLRDRYAIVEP